MRRRLSACLTFFIVATFVVIYGPTLSADAAGEKIQLLNPVGGNDKLTFSFDGVDTAAHLVALANLDQISDPLNPETVSFWWTPDKTPADEDRFTYIGQDASNFADVKWERPRAPADGTAVEVMSVIQRQADANNLAAVGSASRFELTSRFSATRPAGCEIDNDPPCGPRFHAYTGVRIQTAPSIEISDPANGATRTGTITVAGGISTDTTSVAIFAAPAVADNTQSVNYGSPLRTLTIAAGGSAFSTTITLPTSPSGFVAIRARALNAANNFGSDVHVVTINSGFAPTFVVSPEFPGPGDQITYTLTVRNTGAGSATGVSVIVTVPQNPTSGAGTHMVANSESAPLEWTSPPATPTTGSPQFQCTDRPQFLSTRCGGAGADNPEEFFLPPYGPKFAPPTETTTQIKWTTAVFPPGATATFKFRVLLPAPRCCTTSDPTPRMAVGELVTSNAAITSNESAAAASVSAITSSGLVIEKSISKPIVGQNEGPIFLYSITATNVSQVAHINIDVFDVIPPQLLWDPRDVVRTTNGLAKDGFTRNEDYNCRAEAGGTLRCWKDQDSPRNARDSDPLFPRERFTATIPVTVQAVPSTVIVNKASVQGFRNVNTFSNEVKACVDVCPSPPTARLNASPRSGPAPLTVSFDGSQSTDPTNQTTWRLVFGDSTPDVTGTGTVPSAIAHVYRDPGNFTATLHVTNPIGTNSASVPINVGLGQIIPPVGGANTFFFAEGATLSGFREYLLLANQNNQAVTAQVTYYFDDGTAPQMSNEVIPAGGRTTVDVAQRVGEGRTGVSIKVTSPSPIVAERSMFFARDLPNGPINGSTTVLGVNEAKKSWSFAEGSTLPGFQEYVTIQNPGNDTAGVTLTFGVEGAGSLTHSLDVGAGQRQTVDVNAVLGSVVGHSTLVTATKDILVERPMYVNRVVSDDGAVINGGHAAFGTEAAKDFYFAEGTLLPSFATYLTMGNPDAANPVPVTITYFLSDGSTIVKNTSVAAGSRTTVKVFDATDPAGIGRDVSDPVSRGVSFRVSTTSAKGIVAERPMYFHQSFAAGQPEINDGHDQVGAKAVNSRWSFAEGSTLPGFYPFLTILNSGSNAATVAITYTPDTGAPIVRTVSVPATSRVTVQCYGPVEQGGIGGEYTGFGIFVSSNFPVLVERPLYVLRSGIPTLPEINGGSVVVGQPG